MCAHGRRIPALAPMAIGARSQVSAAAANVAFAHNPLNKGAIHSLLQATVARPRVSAPTAVPLAFAWRGACTQPMRKTVQFARLTASAQAGVVSFNIERTHMEYALGW